MTDNVRFLELRFEIESPKFDSHPEQFADEVAAEAVVPLAEEYCLCSTCLRYAA